MCCRRRDFWRCCWERRIRRGPWSDAESEVGREPATHRRPPRAVSRSCRESRRHGQKSAVYQVAKQEWPRGGGLLTPVRGYYGRGGNILGKMKVRGSPAEGGVRPLTVVPMCAKSSGEKAEKTCPPHQTQSQTQIKPAAGGSARRRGTTRSRPKDSGSERELFSEDTETVLTFEDGAVIRLEATVAPGQLIFLTNLLTKQEVVCEVLQKRLLKPAGCYVELQFTERKKGFWEAPQGVAAQAPEPEAGNAKKALGSRESGTKTAAKGPETVDPSRKSLKTLVSEVQELLAKKVASENKELAAGAESAESAEPAAASASANPPAAETTPVDPEQGKAESDDMSDDLLQKPIPVVGARTRKLVWALLLLAVLGLGARYGHWLDFLMRPKVAGPAESMASTQSALAGPMDGAAKSGETEKPAATGRTAEKSQTVAEKSRSEDTSPENATPNEQAPERADEQSARQAHAGRREKSKTSATERGEPPPKDAEPAGQELVPAKVLKSVNPVYPPDAMRSFITGDVKAEVEVEPTGHAGVVKILSGPTQLRNAAVDAVKRYEFSPATRGGKAVPSKLIVAVKFWFNP